MAKDLWPAVAFISIATASHQAWSAKRRPNTRIGAQAAWPRVRRSQRGMETEVMQGGARVLRAVGWGHLT
jgi:hypothetical protein